MEIYTDQGSWYPSLTDQAVIGRILHHVEQVLPADDFNHYANVLNNDADGIRSLDHYELHEELDAKFNDMAELDLEEGTTWVEYYEKLADDNFPFWRTVWEQDEVFIETWLELKQYTAMIRFSREEKNRMKLLDHYYETKILQPAVQQFNESQVSSFEREREEARGRAQDMDIAERTGGMHAGINLYAHARKDNDYYPLMAHEREDYIARLDEEAHRPDTTTTTVWNARQTEKTSLLDFALKGTGK